MTVIEGVLASTVTLGLCKTTCNLLFLPAVRASVNSICFCCCCLLIFTDLTVTAFLAVLWLAEPWLPPFPVSNDVIALRFLLFLGHTYGAVLLLTIPLIGMEMACKLLLVPASKSQVDRGGPQDGESGGWRQGVETVRWWRKGAGTGRGWREARHGWNAVQETDTQAKEEEKLQFSPVPGFLCSLLAWVLCGVWGGQGCWSEQQDVEACIQRAGSLSLCLPDLVTVTQSAGTDPSLTLPALLLFLALPVSLSVLRRGQTQGQTDQRTHQVVQEVRESADAQLSLHQLPAHHSHMQHNVTVLAPAIIPEGTSHRQTVHMHTTGLQSRSLQAVPPTNFIVHFPYLSVESNRDENQNASPERVNTQTHCDPSKCADPTQTPHRSSGLSKCLSYAPCDPAPAVFPKGHTYFLCRTLGASLLAGLLCALALFLLPPSLAFNPVLICSMVSLAEWKLKY